MCESYTNPALFPAFPITRQSEFAGREDQGIKGGKRSVS